MHSDVDAGLRLFLDLGDMFTKGISIHGGERHELRFPSVVAHRLLAERADPTGLLMDGGDDLPRAAGFDPSDYPRTRSYRGARAYLREVRDRPGPGARFAGRLAVVYGADRERLGSHPSVENVDALVRKALILASAAGHRGDRAEIVLAVDAGAKAEAALEWARRSPRTIDATVRTLRGAGSRRIEVSARARVVDAADCVVAALPAEMDLDRLGRILVVDIGYRRTKLAMMSIEGCEHQEQLHDLGVSDCIRRVLRDGQDQLLIEDEFAVMEALERSQGVIEVAGRRFDIARELGAARRGLEEELERAIARAVLQQLDGRGEPCRAVAIVGGGAALVGAGLAERIQRSDLGATWVADDTSHFLVTGAVRLQEQGALA